MATPITRWPRWAARAARRPRRIAANWNLRCACARNWPRRASPRKAPKGDWTVKGTRDIFLISAGTQHGVNREVKTRLDAFLKQYGDQGRQDPDHIKFVTYTTRYNECFWVTLDGPGPVLRARGGGCGAHRWREAIPDHDEKPDAADAARDFTSRRHPDRRAGAQSEARPRDRSRKIRRFVARGPLRPNGPACIRSTRCRVLSTMRFWIPFCWSAPPERPGTPPPISRPCARWSTSTTNGP